MIYDGHRNTVIIWKDGRREKIIPLEEDGSNKGSENNYWEKTVLICSAKEFLKEVKKQHCTFIIVLKRLNVEIQMEDILIEV